MKQNNFFILLLIVGFTTIMTAQVPSYIPTNGLVGYWPFNGNANDVSTNANNGTNNGATLTTDRFGNANSAYNFDGVSSKVIIANNSSLPNKNFTISLWFQTIYNGNSNYNNGLGRYLYAKGSDICPFRAVVNALPYAPPSNITQQVGINGVYTTCDNKFSDPNDSWHQLIFTYDGTSQKQYIDGILSSSASLTGFLQTNIGDLSIGCRFRNSSFNDYFLGKIDDFGIWNRALTTDEITNLYNANICYQSVTVTDTLVINVGILGYNPVTYNNSITIYPNPAKDHITIDCGTLSSVTGYQIKISNLLGQEVFSTTLNQQQYSIPLNSWTGKGIYLVKVYDASSNLLTTRKIDLQ